MIVSSAVRERYEISRLRVAPDGVPRLARSRRPWRVLVGEHQVGLSGVRTRRSANFAPRSDDRVLARHFHKDVG